MEIIKNSLMAAALTTILSSCGAPALYRVEQGNIPEPSEYFSLDNQLVDSGHDSKICDLDITFTPYSYRIECSGKGYFYHGEGSYDHLQWNSVNYHDENQDGNVDYFEVDIANINSRSNDDINDVYRSVLSSLRVNRVERAWRDRYRYSCDQ